MTYLAMQLTIPGLPTVALANRNARGIGAAGELTARLMFERAGYQVSTAAKLHGDLCCIDPDTGEMKHVEVKTARQAKDKKWRFTLVSKGTNHRHADFVLLLAALKSGRVIPFLIPVEAIANQRQAVICSHPESYSGKLAQFRQMGALSL